MRIAKVVLLTFLMMSTAGVFFFTDIVKASDTQYEYYAGTLQGDLTVYDVYWRCQTFTIGTVGTNEKHNITSIKLDIRKYGLPTGKARVSIYATSGGKPTGTPINYVQFLASSLSTSYSYVEFTFSGACPVVTSTKYAIVLNLTGGTFSNDIEWGTHSSSGYSGGNEMYSSNSGSTWTNETKDLLFYEYGLSNHAPTMSLISPVNSSTALSLQPKISVYANDSDLNLLTVTFRSNYTGSYVTYQVNSSFTANTICRWQFTGANTQFKKYYYTIYVYDGIINISKWFCFTTVLIYMNISNVVNPSNNSFHNYTLNYTVFSTWLDEFNPILNLSFTKTCLQGYNTTTKLYFNNTYLLTYTFINGTKTFNLFNYYLPSLKTNTNYSWSINTTFYNLSYNRTYHFKFNILFINLPSGSCDNTSLTLYEDIVHANGTHESQYNATTGWKVWANYTGNQSGLVVIENIINAHGTHDYQWRPLLGDNGEWWVWANYTGNVSCGSTNLTLIRNLVNTNGTNETSYDALTGWTAWLNFTGTGGNVSGAMVVLSNPVNSVGFLTTGFIVSMAIFVGKTKKKKRIGPEEEQQEMETVNEPE